MGRALGILFLCCALDSGAQQWYRSDATGLPREAVSQGRALREDYGLSLEPRPLAAAEEAFGIPLEAGWRAERYVLYEKGSPVRERWTCTDQAGVQRAQLLGMPDGTGLVERYDSRGCLSEQRQRDGKGGEVRTRYAYEGQRIRSAETEAYPGPVRLWTERYFYGRTGALASIERTTPDGLVRAARPGELGLAAAAAGADTTVDDRGRILSELRRDQEGRTVEEIRNTWEGDRLLAVVRVAGDAEFRTEYGYDPAGTRVLEKNYRNGALERQVALKDGREVEELYVDGNLVLRAIWEAGLKVAEERIRPAQGQGR